MSESFLFYDLETFGADPRRSRIAQFAAIRTDAELQEIAAPISVFVQPAEDLLPSPEAVLITHITPQKALQAGLLEADAMRLVAEEMAQPGTCTLGYNSLRFDDEFVRFGFWRNFIDPYQREWQNGNSRWDLLDVVRLAHALRPQGIQWRRREDGLGTSFKLEHLAEDNGLRQGMAHEALSDVRALIGLARQLRTAQPKLWEYALGLRNKQAVRRMLDPFAMPILLHVSQRFAASRLCAAPVMPLAVHPHIDSRVIVFDLGEDIEPLLTLDAEQISERLYTPREALPEGMSRVALKEVHSNRCPMLVEWRHLRPADFERLAIDPDVIQARAERLRRHAPQLAEKLRQVFARPAGEEQPDADAALYAGFIPAQDKRLLAEVRACPPERLGQADFAFADPRLAELLFRYRARNWPQTLTLAEQEKWMAYRRHRLLDETTSGELCLSAYRAQIACLREQHADNAHALELLEHLDAWGNRLEGRLA